ncbi:hypothetical protein [Sinorhizobium sp. NFACC03]|uniref:hypothetical protein n=1 Tax=Sinorhizobium sp. NFACC03 TaxID=1566295 RepID=UPI001AECEEAF|nr:hypothetical protein [Sinorhizobium sp. NFACC03]
MALLQTNEPALAGAHSKGNGRHMTNRKDIAHRVISKWRDFGFPIDDDPEFQALLKLWINGDVSVDDIRRRYVKLLQERIRKGKPD